jgi:hypothetical protein
MIIRSRWLLATTAGAFLLTGCVDEGPTAPGPLQHTVMPGTAATYSGRAVVVQANVLGTRTQVSEAKIGSSGGASEASLLTVSVPKLITARVAHASTVAQGRHSRSMASVADVNLTVAGHTIEAVLLQARATAECRKDGSIFLRGESVIAQLVIDGKSIAVSGAPNQTIALGVGKVIINEQRKSTNSITVNALHVVIPGVADVIISSAQAGITCPSDDVCPPAHGDFMTGGGWIEVSGGAKGTFGVAGGIRQQGLWGHLTYHDHGIRLKVKAKTITAYVVTGPTSRRIEGTAEIDGVHGTFSVDVADNGEPGREDTFVLRLSTGYTAGGKLQGGNLQLHERPSDCR